MEHVAEVGRQQARVEQLVGDAADAGRDGEGGDPIRQPCDSRPARPHGERASCEHARLQKTGQPRVETQGSDRIGAGGT